MGLLDSIKGFVGNQNKQPNSIVTPLPSHQLTESLVDSTQLLDQYFGWTYKAIKTKADSLVSYDQELIEENTRGETKKIEDTQLRKDLKRFNSFQTLTDARRLTFTHKMLAGSAFWLITDAEEKGFKNEYFVLDPTRMQVMTDKFGIPSSYRYQDPDGREQIIPVEDLIIFRETNPKNWLKGYSQVWASRFSHNSWELASKFNMNTFANMGVFSLLLAEGISETERTRLESKLRQKYTGTENARKIGVVNGRLDILDISKGPKDLDFVEGSKMLRDEILALHGVPKPLVGLTDSTFTNSAEAQRIFQRYTLLPELTMERDVLNEQLIPKYFPIQTTKTIIFVFDDPVEADSEKISKEASLLWEKGVVTKNEARAMVGLDQIENGDEFIELLNPVSQLATGIQQDTEKNMKSIKKQVERMEDIFNRIPEVEEQVAEQRKEMKAFFMKQNKDTEKEFAETLVEYFGEQRERLLDSIKEIKQVNIKLDIDTDKENKEFVDKMGSSFLTVATAFAAIANDLLGREGEDRLPIPGRTLRNIQKSTIEAAKSINKTTKEKIQKIISKGIEENLGLEDIKKQVVALFDDITDLDNPTKQVRAELIVRTEVNNIKNSTMRDMFEAGGADALEWLTAQDADVRSFIKGDAFDHVIVDGQIQPVGESFNVSGEFLKYPSDPAGSAGNTINCRCTLIPVIR